MGPLSPATVALMASKEEKGRGGGREGKEEEKEIGPRPQHSKLSLCLQCQHCIQPEVHVLTADGLGKQRNPNPNPWTPAPKLLVAAWRQWVLS